jgi:hypothetical protein
MPEQACPRCGKPAEKMNSIGPSLAKKIADSGISEQLPPRVCDSCFQEVAGSLGGGSLLHAQAKQKEQHKMSLWKSRVNLIKKARIKMNQKHYSEAAVEYEKYIRILEVVFGAEPGKLSPEHFRESARTQEITVVAGVYWDLMKIYDTSSSYGDRMKMAARKLAQFLRFTPVYPDIIRKAEAFAKKAKHSDVVKAFLKEASSSKGRCFIATAAFNSYEASEVIILSQWRDQVLLKSKSGKFFVQIYYKTSPPIARALDLMPVLKAPVRAALRTFIHSAIRHLD